eukprot:CAMPEP_0116127434 /NCGR_PEP_ID=MMETSP0329-20121206/6838_1 /TAXON_ID=697910 /ORGANISM="Pseudo-nitzschia arenysensis, Strain B593" /LENGTH=593 /DNA_ID=CAMNT_0003621533 /DNA_START=606 /DNA_END=2390 /DNA_ORIENTATION=+
MSKPNSPATIIVSPSSNVSSSPPRSPSRSPIAAWFIGSYNSESDSSQKSEWEKACNPLIIFSGLEAIYYSCSHVESHDKALALVRLYKRTIDDLLVVRKALCDPFVYSTRNDQSPGPTATSTYKEKALTLSLSVEAIMSICKCRCKLIEQQIIIFISKNIDTEKAITTFQTIFHNLPKEGAKSTPITKSVIREVEGWCSIMKAYSSFGKYRFLNTIVGCQKIKLKLNDSSDTRIQKWMSNVYQSFVSMLPIYFQSVSSDVLSRYGYQESSFRIKPGENKPGQNLNLESKFEEFLRFEERSGTPFALAVVASVDDFHMHRSLSKPGSIFSGKEKTSNINRSMLESFDLLSEFPAVFIRTTTDQYSSGNLLGARRNSGKKDEYDYTMAKKRSSHIQSRVEMNSWPFTSWGNVIPMLKNHMLLSPDGDSLEMNWSQVDSDTSIYASPIDDVMWLVAMKKANDESRWNRRYDDEERATKEKQFFSDILASLRLRDIFKSNLKVSSGDTDRLLNELSNTMVANTRLLDTDNSSQLLESFKRIFGLRSLNTKYSGHFQNQNAMLTPKSVEDLRTGSSPLPSHFAFFLGSHLMDFSHVGG